jgi:uncharacterized protein YnzC (UPF0291/DUF896 family)
MAEIANVVLQLTEIVSGMNIPVPEGGATEDYLCAVARGLIQFVCVRDGRELYRSLTADKILIHPGSVMFKLNPEYIIAGEIVRTTRMYAMSVSPLSYSLLTRISRSLAAGLGRTRYEEAPLFYKKKKSRFVTEDEQAARGPRLKRARDFTSHIKIGREVFEIEMIKGKKQVRLPWENLKSVINDINPETAFIYKNLRGVIVLDGKYNLLAGEKLKLILSLAPTLEIEGAPLRQWSGHKNFNSASNLDELLEVLPNLVKPALWRQGKKELGFICLLSGGYGNYRLKCSRGFHTSLNDSLASVESLIDELGDDVDVEKKHIVNQCYRRLSDYLS